MAAFEVGAAGFVLDGEPFRVISGALHYFRVHPDHWRDRLEKARQLGLNTIDTYVSWNFHSTAPGEFRLDGWRDLGRFLDLAGELGLYAIVRPGPYICAEWANGGFPTWLTAAGDVRLRSADPRYLDAVAGYYASVLPVVARRQVSRGGNVLMVQVENEYGAYGDDPAYLQALVELVRGEGIDVPLFTCDQAEDGMLQRGGLPELLRTATFGSRVAERLATLRRHQPTGPLMCAEFWNGWFDSWGQHHHTTDVGASAESLDDLLAAGASVNLYMFHGGTNFGLTNGANHKGTYAPITTSYDYDAPLAEDGSPGAKFAAYREVISRHAPVPTVGPADAEPAPAFTVPLRRGRSWTDFARPLRAFDHLPSLEEIDPGAVFALYETDLRGDDGAIGFGSVRDRAECFVDGVGVGTMLRQLHETGLSLPQGADGRLQLLVSDLGRVDYGCRLGEPKGLIGPARTATRTLTAWRAAGIDHQALGYHGHEGGGEAIDPDSTVGGPLVAWASFDAQPGRDLFLDVSGWGHGVAWLNGFCLGRYWSAGPTRTLYVPGPEVRETGNSLVVWEFATCGRPQARFVPRPQLGHTEV
jgi:beta-galactosidase